MNEYSCKVLIVVPSYLKDVANVIGKALDPDSLGDMTFNDLHTDGLADFYVAESPCIPTFASMVGQLLMANSTVLQYTLAIYAERFPDWVSPTDQECQAFLDTAIIRVDEVYQEVLDELGLSNTARLAEEALAFEAEMEAATAQALLDKAIRDEAAALAESELLTGGIQ